MADCENKKELSLSNEERKWIAAMPIDVGFWVEAVVAARDREFFGRATNEALYRTRCVQLEDRCERLYAAYEELSKKYRELKKN